MPFVVERVDPSDWDALVSEMPERTVFHHLPWLRALARARSLEAVLLAVRRGPRVEAIWPCFATRRGGLRIVASPLPATATPYLGPLFHADVDADETLAALLEDPLLRDAAYVACRVMSRARAVDLTSHGFTSTRRFETSCVALGRSEDDLWQGLKSECRGRVRKAEKLGVEVRRETTDDFLEDFWRMTLETFDRTGSQPTHSRELTREVWRELHPAGQLLAMSAFLGARRIAIAVLPHDERTIYYWAGVASSADRSIPAANLLQWHAIVEGHRLGLESYDMISADGGSGRFKRTFGARDVETATHWERSASAWVAAAKRIYEGYTRIRLGFPGAGARARARKPRPRVAANGCSAGVATARITEDRRRRTARLFFRGS